MKKVFALLLIGSFALTSCGPRRYKCGPYRRCENSTKFIEESKVIEHQLTDNIC